MTKEILKQALEALESDNPYLRQLAANAIRNAFVQPEQEPVAYYHPHKGFYWAKPTHISAPTAVDVPPVPLYTVPPAAQPEQEPVAWMFQHDETGRMNYVSNDGANTPELFLKRNPRYALVCSLYTTPPTAQRSWQGLTDEEIWSADPRIETSDSNVNPYQILKSARTIEAMLKEKNYG